MARVWFIKIDNVEKGPFNIEELKDRKDITPETLVRHEGEKRWKPIKDVEELKEIFKDKRGKPSNVEEEEEAAEVEIDGAKALEAEFFGGPFNEWLFWVAASLLVIYTFFVLQK